MVPRLTSILALAALFSLARDQGVGIRLDP
jgi:hypothetical protein